MNKISKLITMTSLSLAITACGGGGGGGGGNTSASPAQTPAATPTQTPAQLPASAIQPAAISTSDIVVPVGFSFDIGEKISLSMDYTGTTSGALHLYSESAFVMSNGDVVADPLSRITTVYPTQIDVVELEVNGNWEQIYARWVPMSSSEKEQSWVISLDQSSNSYHLAF
ncbi:Lipoprotein [Vibrio crassostreae]|nr:Lipoprotein [Vibrio crassostreae]CAK2101032.1 Lipoprotein [Vibrio crassostreae]CAK2125303.1 Lipoprotein [Vibrio crassostreae]CAK2349473.1 Lipoprotein [Vibrio crassostreae]CAK2659157.1 Lipoprotein [Vibrio crassostreae]